MGRAFSAALFAYMFGVNGRGINIAILVDSHLVNINRQVAKPFNLFESGGVHHHQVMHIIRGIEAVTTNA